MKIELNNPRVKSLFARVMESKQSARIPDNHASYVITYARLKKLDETVVRAGTAKIFERDLFKAEVCVSQFRMFAAERLKKNEEKAKEFLDKIIKGFADDYPNDPVTKQLQGGL